MSDGGCQRIPGESTGADAEVELALDLGIQVAHSISELADLLTD